ncbi:MAG: hypothetical protein Q8K98_02010 [Bacteroidota bacterium]|nr:hypothetical protein [Bacteroidota bacterium]
MWHTLIIITVALLAGILILTYTWVEISSRNQEKKRHSNTNYKG